MLTELAARFPMICRLADDGKIFQADVAALAAIRATNANSRPFVDAMLDSNMQAKALMMALSFPIAAPEATDLAAQQLEADLQGLAPVIGEARLGTVFQQKLLARKPDQWVDTVHEVAVAAAALNFFDPGTIELEKQIPNTANNSDLYGLRNGCPVRIDATVVHDNWPPPSGGDTVQAFSRGTMDKAEMEDINAKNPRGVVTLANIKTNSATHTNTPLSTKVWQALQKKLRQCEPGCVNIIAIGLPRPKIDDHGTEDAVLGVVHMVVDPKSGKGFPARHRTGPFVPVQYSPDVVQWIDPFRIMSAVWLLRWNVGYPLSKILPNPNATTLLNGTDAADMVTVGTNRATRR